MHSFVESTGDTLKLCRNYITAVRIQCLSYHLWANQETQDDIKFFQLKLESLQSKQVSFIPTYGKRQVPLKLQKEILLS